MEKKTVYDLITELHEFDQETPVQIKGHVKWDEPKAVVDIDVLRDEDDNDLVVFLVVEDD